MMECVKERDNQFLLEIIAEMIKEKKSGKKVQNIKAEKPKVHICSSLNDDGN